MIRVVAAEDSFLIRQGLRQLLEMQRHIELVAIAQSLPELLAVVAEQGPDVVITDVRMPPDHEDEGIRAAEEWARTHPDLGVVVLSQYLEPDWALRLFEPSAARRAYLLKERVGDVAQLRQAIEAVADGGSMLDAKVVDALVTARAAARKSPLGRLTAREAEVLGLMAAGLSNGAIAERLVLTSRAVEKHITSVFAKLDLAPDDSGVNRRVRAVLLFLAESA